ncbi:uncharacterized protein Z520_10335 [Fonsecaea multimorphosa CBS 102226]|uniref:Uncharacterized protein n=1 Tax=Fonsecaea multimorphosa CBS 102226 TaxID=1442371 RepID=A0A0D2KBJ2_9EURO|nr:uncharacterized protein Z520_10335 [Fonsecaea multimorphosa CBS 102226]KIX93998.1 hypothetical protein Z520_10335 [Fonsecaea multimorphosa CBS 102226]OAL19345.1 hypothetical protein AYO22_09889 [Fonsecaea multimorphosa]
MALKSFVLGVLLFIAVGVCDSAKPIPNGNPSVTMVTAVRRVALRPTSTGISPVAKATLDNNVTAESSPPLPDPPRTCVREALVALANWRLHCDRGSFIPPYKCWTRAPSIERCCGKWVDEDDQNYKGYPSVRISKEVQTGETSWEWQWIPQVDNKGHREVILQTVDEYHSDKTECQRWRAEDRKEFMAFLQNLDDYGIYDADNTGKVLDSTVPRYNPEGGGYYDDGNPKYPSLPDGPPIGW